MENATAVVAQTERQRELLLSTYARTAALVRNCCPDPGEEACNREDVLSERPRVLWVGRITWEKRLQWLLDVAEQCREMDFDVVGVDGGRDEKGESIVTRAERAPNVRMHGYVPHSRIGEVYASATLLCCTSSYEGFPNTFLEAWSRGVPVLSTFDPDGIIGRHRAGWTATTVEELVSVLKKVTASREALACAGAAARAYYCKNHSPDTCLPALASVFLEMIEKGRKVGPGPRV